MQERYRVFHYCALLLYFHWRLAFVRTGPSFVVGVKGGGQT